MYCVIQEIETKKEDKTGYSKELISEYIGFTISGQKCGRYCHYYSSERFERPIKKAYRISIHESYREKGKVKKRQFYICTVGYYSLADEYDRCYDVFGVLQNKEYLEKIKAEYKARKEYEKRTRRYYKNFYNSYKGYGSDSSKWDFGGGNGGSCNRNIPLGSKYIDKSILKQFYWDLSKKYHPDASPDKDTSKQMQILNQLKADWGV